MQMPVSHSFDLHLADGSKTIGHLQVLDFELDHTPYTRWKVTFDEFGNQFEAIVINIEEFEVETLLNYERFMKFIWEDMSPRTRFGKMMIK